MIYLKAFLAVLFCLDWLFFGWIMTIFTPYDRMDMAVRYSWASPLIIVCLGILFWPRWNDVMAIAVSLGIFIVWNEAVLDPLVYYWLSSFGFCPWSLSFFF